MRKWTCWTPRGTAVPDEQPFKLATCSWFEYTPDMGMAIRASLGTPRWKNPPIPDAYVTELTPRGSYFNAEHDEFTRMFLAQLDRFGVDHLTDKFTKLAEFGSGAPLVFLCFEKQAVNGDVCHRRLFAEWWLERTGVEVPELGWLPPQKVEQPPPDPTLF